MTYLPDFSRVFSSSVCRPPRSACAIAIAAAAALSACGGGDYEASAADVKANDIASSASGAGLSEASQKSLQLVQSNSLGTKQGSAPVGTSPSARLAAVQGLNPGIRPLAMQSIRPVAVPGTASPNSTQAAVPGTAGPNSAPAAGQNTPPNAKPAEGQSACDTASGTVLEVGPGKRYAKPSAAAVAARAGDVIKIQAGQYRGDVAYWGANNLTICGVGGRARLYADGKSSGGKAIWVTAGSNITIDSIEFHDTVVPDKNGAGIRMEHKTGDLRVVNSGFFNNQNGILTTGGPVTLTIERSEFSNNSNNRTDGQTHNIYAGAIDKLTVSASYFHEARYGSNLKSRAKVSIVENSYLMDGANGPSSYLTDFSNGGKVVLRGNMLHQGPKAPNGVLIQFGAEGKRWTDNSLEMVNNTVVTTRSNSTFLRVMPWAQSVKLSANIFASNAAKDTLISGSEFPLKSIVQQSNVVMRADAIPGALNLTAPNFWPNAQSLPLTALQALPDRSYTHDAPALYTLRAIASKSPRAGALQSAP